MITHSIMTLKQEKILSSALELFAKNGFNATSTSKVAKHAGVSEGLIFRHFENKQGLLDAISKLAEDKMGAIFYNIISETDPKSQIRLFLQLPFNIQDKDKEFWKLQLKLKWELNTHKEEKMKPIMDILINAFTKLDYKHPQMEAKFVMFFIEGLSTSMLRDNSQFDKDHLNQFLAEKYNL